MIRTLVSAAAFVVLLGAACQALPLTPLPSDLGAPDVTLVEGGCGPGGFRDVYGRCRPARPPVVVAPGPVVVAPAPGVVVVEPRVCGAGFRWHTYRRRCVPI